MTGTGTGSPEPRPSVFVHLLPGLIPPGALAGGTAVVIDVLRATTVMVRALASGCRAVVPCGELDEARAAASSLPAGTALLAGERQGLPIPGFDLGNSPDDFTPEACRGKTLVMTTTNGTRAVLASLPADRVAVAALTNEAAVARWAAEGSRDVHVVCAGTDGRVSWEDTLLAGRLVETLGKASRYEPGNDSAMLARDAYLRSRDRTLPAPWPAILAEGRGGRRVTEIGLARDIEAAGRWDEFDLVPVVRREPLGIVAESVG